MEDLQSVYNPEDAEMKSNTLSITLNKNGDDKSFASGNIIHFLGLEDIRLWWHLLRNRLLDLLNKPVACKLKPCQQ